MKTISHSGIAALFFAVLSCPAALVSAHQHDTALGRDALLEVFAWDPKTAEITSEKVADGLYVLFGLGRQYRGVRWIRRRAHCRRPNT